VRCYVASPRGVTDSGRHYYLSVYLPALREVVEVLDPWSMTTAEEWRSAERDGTVGVLGAEIGFAAGVGVRCFGLRTDLRESGETGFAVNLQVEAFVVASGGHIAGSLEELVEALRAASA
jgi:hypothetical protein